MDQNTGFKGLLVTLWQRVVLSYKTTLIGVGVYGIGVLVDYYLQSPNKTVSAVAGVIGAVLALVKEKYPAPKPDAPPAPPAV